VTATEIAAGAITTAKIAALAVTASEIAAGAVTADKIVANAVTTAKLDALAVTADKIAANAITAGKIDAGAVTAIKIAAGAITADKLDALSVTAAKLAALAVTADKIAAGAITADKIAADAITGKTITGATINGGTISGTTLNAASALTVAPGGSINFQFVNAGTTYDSQVNTDGAYGGVQFEHKLRADSFATRLAGTTLHLSVGTGTANVRSAGDTSALQRISSMRAYKLDRLPIGTNYNLLDLPSMTWRDRSMVEEDPDTPIRIAGFVAEDLAALSAFCDGEFDSLLEIDEDGRATGIAYDRLVAFLMPIVRDLHARVTALEPPTD
jgi:hypothetical protein